MKGIEDTAYSSFKRNYINHTPSLKCANKNDRFTVNNSIGNAKLANPIALITTDEVYMAGAFTGDLTNNYIIRNPDFYLYKNYLYWTMTPSAAVGGNAFVDVQRNGNLGNDRVDVSSDGVRPVVSLSSDAISGGSGTMSDPFTVS